MNIEFTSQIQPQIALPYDSASADRNGIIIDLLTVNSICFAVHFHAMTAGASGTVHLQAGQASDGSDFDDLAGSSFTWSDGNANTGFFTEVERTENRYIRLVVKKPTANASAESAMAYLYNSGRKPAPKTFPIDFLLAPPFGPP